MITLALLHTMIRKEEKLIMQAASACGIRALPVDIRREIFAPDSPLPECDVVLQRSISTVKGGYAAAYYEFRGIPVINSSKVAHVCADKYLTSLLLSKAGIPTPRFAMTFNLESSLQAVESMGGFPVVLKPAQGSWGRLLARVNDRDALEAVLEHKAVLGTPPHKAFYLQEYIHKPGYDIRAFTVDGDLICAIARDSEHWISNTARGSRARAFAATPELRAICLRTSETIGGGLLAIDLFASGAGFLVNEVNHTMEFKNSEEPTGVSISGAVVEYCRQTAAAQINPRSR